MKLKRTVLLAAFVVTMFLPAAASAAIVDNGDGLIYDDVLDITWAQPSDDANDWNSAKAWAEGLRLGGVSGWRLPYTSVGAGEGFSTNPVKCSIASELDCRDNELGYMFYHNLSGTFDQPILTSGDPDLALFPTLQSSDYWSGTSGDIADATGWAFDFFQGTQFTGRNQPFLSWAVHAGNVVPADPVTIGGSVTGLEGSGLVLQNNGSDDLLRDSGGPFEFATSLTPGSIYNVTVKTQPSNPTQTCIVENGSGTVPTEDVTNVAVSCTEAILGDLVKVAAEGDTLPDGTVLRDILLDGGVAINLDGQVAFGGRGDDNTDAVFTQAGKIVAVGDTLGDGKTLTALHGEVGIAGGLSSDQVAFHGKFETGFDDPDTVAVFTQVHEIAAVGDAIAGEVFLVDIDSEGKVAINNFDQVAFHGKAVDQEDGHEFDLERVRVVIISDDNSDQSVAAQEGDALADGTLVEDISESGGVAINDMDEVAFHGRVGDLKAVFTSNDRVDARGTAALEGDTLADGTLLDDIEVNGGVAINLFGDVAFHGDAIDPAVGGDSVKAVFTQNGLVAKEGDILPDSTPLEEIEVNGGVAINVFGHVAFHGRTGGVKAVFTQDGLVAKVGDNLADGTTLREIWDTAGVAINPYDLQVAFHGKVGTTDAVFVGLAPIVDSDESSNE
jgi:hypothetical protein